MVLLSRTVLEATGVPTCGIGNRHQTWRPGNLSGRPRVPALPELSICERRTCDRRSGTSIIRMQSVIAPGGGNPTVWQTTNSEALDFPHAAFGPHPRLEPSCRAQMTEPRRRCHRQWRALSASAYPSDATIRCLRGIRRGRSRMGWRLRGLAHPVRCRCLRRRPGGAAAHRPGTRDSSRRRRSSPSTTLSGLRSRRLMPSASREDCLHSLWREASRPKGWLLPGNEAATPVDVTPLTRVRQRAVGRGQGIDQYPAGVVGQPPAFDLERQIAF
jgi:hypothetical protein